MQSPAGYKSIREAMDLQGVSYAVVYRSVQRAKVRSTINDRGEILIKEEDVPLITEHVPTPIAERERVHVYLTPDVDRHRGWERAARQRGESVSAMAYRLMDSTSARIAKRSRRKAKRKQRQAKRS